MTSAIEVHAAALRIVLHSSDEACKLAEGLMVNASLAENRGFKRCELAENFGFDPARMGKAERYEIAAAALTIAAEYEQLLTPFEKWFRRKYTASERQQFTSRDRRLMEIGFTSRSDSHG